MGANKTSLTGDRPAVRDDWDFSGVSGAAVSESHGRRLLRWPPPRGVVVLLVVLIVLAVAAYLYDRSNSDMIRAGVSVAGVDIGGLSRDEATSKLRAELGPKLLRSVKVRAAGQRFKLTPSQAALRLDTDGMVDAAIDRSRTDILPVRVVDDLTGQRDDVDLDSQVNYSQIAVRRFARKVKSSVDKDPVDAKVDFETADLPVVPSEKGLRVNAASLRRSIGSALAVTRLRGRSVRPHIRTIAPDVTSADLAPKYPTVVTVDRNSFRLRLFKDLKLAKTYPIAVGQAGLETPAGLYHVQNKTVDPAWSVPKKSWAGDLAGKVIPGGAPDNPLKARWLGVYDGAGIHGTSDVNSLGTAASHGCIRMKVSDVIQLYDKVPTGAPVYIQ